MKIFKIYNRENIDFYLEDYIRREYLNLILEILYRRKEINLNSSYSKSMIDLMILNFQDI